MGLRELQLCEISSCYIGTHTAGLGKDHNLKIKIQDKDQRSWSRSFYYFADDLNYDLDHL